FLAMDRQTEEAGCPVFGSGGHDAADSPESRLMGFPIQEHPDRVRAADPAGYVHADVPPFLVQHGTRDCVVPCAQGQWLADRIAAVAGPGRVIFETLDGGHGGRAFDDVANVDRVLDFLLRHI
ncbi:MAG TPA: prolyl oligopeptidase family serine peptidase, partial [Longimicrobiales bacterium]|nr:prolyl oligopeptidase family serine peptidase [Longimicrobiales bacterium]